MRVVTKKKRRENSRWVVRESYGLLEMKLEMYSRSWFKNWRITKKNPVKVNCFSSKNHYVNVDRTARCAGISLKRTSVSRRRMHRPSNGFDPMKRIRVQNFTRKYLERKMPND